MSFCRLVCCLLLSGFIAPVVACEYPSFPSMPTDERIRGRLERAVKEDMVRYVTEMSVYVACVRAEHNAAVRDGALDVVVALLAARNNVAIDELEAVRDIYEEEVGPFEELFFDLPFDSDSGRADAAPRLQRLPTGSDTVLQRAEQTRGGGDCARQPACIEFARPGID